MKKFYFAVNILCSLGFLVLIYVFMSAQYIRFDAVMSDALDVPGFYHFAYAFNQGLNNTVFTTAFGFIFYALFGFAFWFLDAFNLGLNKLIWTASFFFACLTIIVWAMIRFFTKYKIPYIFLLMVILLSINSFSVFVFLDWRNGLGWASMYHNNLWGLLSVQIALTLLIFKDRSSLKMLASKDVYILAFIESIVLFLTFNGKVNSFAAAALLSCSFLPFLTLKNALRYVVCLFALFIFENIFVSILFDYSYSSYFESLKNVFSNRSQNPDYDNRGIKLIKHLLYSPVIFFAVAACLNANKIIGIIKSPDGIYGKIKFFICELKKRTALESIAFSALFTLAVFIVIEGNTTDGARCFIIPVLLCFFTFWEYKYKKLLFVLCCAAYFLYIDVIYISAQLAPKFGTDYKEVVLSNANPHRSLKFFYKPDNFQKRAKDASEKWNKNIYSKDMSQVFDELIQMRNSFNLNYNDKVLFCGLINYAPFVLNTAVPIPSYHITHITGGEGPATKEETKTIINASDIVVFMKDINRLADEGEEEMYMSAFKEMDEYKPFYETDNLLFYAKQEWIDKRIGKGNKLPIVDKKGRGDIVKTIAEAK